MTACRTKYSGISPWGICPKYGVLDIPSEVSMVNTMMPGAAQSQPRALAGDGCAPGQWLALGGLTNGHWWGKASEVFTISAFHRVIFTNYRVPQLLQTKVRNPNLCHIKTEGIWLTEGPVSTPTNIGPPQCPGLPHLPRRTEPRSLDRDRISKAELRSPRTVEPSGRGR